MLPFAPSQAPLFNLRGFIIAAFAAFVLCWPAVLGNSVFVFSDSKSYFNAGEEIWTLALDYFQPAPPAGDAGLQSPAKESVDTNTAADKLLFNGEPRFGRSIAYSVFFYPAMIAIGPLGLAWAQGTLTLFALFALVTPEMLKSRRILIVGMAVVMAVTQFPWRTVYLMPDIFAATIVIFGMCLAGPFDRMTRLQQALLTLLTCFAVATHYGNIPFAAGFFGLILLFRLITLQITLASVVAATIAIGASPLANFGASVAVLDEPSVVPLRLPIVLARSIQDGPGAAYLRENCDDENWAICQAFGDRLPESIRAFLWSEEGIRAQPADMVQRIRDEEASLLFNIFLAYPAEQTWSFAGNAVKQLFQVGQGEIKPIASFDSLWSQTVEKQPAGLELLETFDPLVTWSTVISVLALAWLLANRRCTSNERAVILAMGLGLVCNAIVFGGLSAPVDRYQARVVWLVPACFVLFLAAIAKRQVRPHHAAMEVSDAR